MVAAALVSAVSTQSALAVCNIADAELEEAILQKPELRGPAGSQMVRDLRHMRDTAFILWSYGRHEDCERILGNIRELVSTPSMASLGDNDEDEADQQFAAREPLIQRGAAAGQRGEDGALPLLRIGDLATGLRANEFIGAEVRSSDDKIIGEVRNIVLATADYQAYAIVASGGFFTPGTDSLVVPIHSLYVSEERSVFFLPMPEAESQKLPLMPDQEFYWLTDDAWRSANDKLFSRPWH
jgi:hypothetical protein